MKSDTFKIATLFSGAGGLDSGFVNTGRFENQIANDILPSPAKTYSKHHNTEIQTVEDFNNSPKFPVYIVGDVAHIDFQHLRNIDCIIGGPPCQDFSITRGGKGGLGIKTTRGRLYSHFIRALKISSPKIFVFENVPGLVSYNNGESYKTIIKDFEQLEVKLPETTEKYSLIYKGVTNSADVGVPQKRKRLIIVGIRKDLLSFTHDSNIMRQSKEILRGDRSLLNKYPLTAMETFEGKSIPELATKYSKIMKEYDGLEKEVNTTESNIWKEKTWDKLTFDPVQDYLISNEITPDSEGELESAFDEHKTLLKELGYYGKPLTDRVFEDGSNEIAKEGEKVRDRMAHIPPNMNHSFVEGTKWTVKGRMSNIYRRTHPLKPGYTVLAYGGGGTWSYHYEKNRSALTNRERARLQTFPDDYLFEGSREHIRAQVGEAVPVRLGTKLAEVVLNALKKRDW